MKYLKEIEAKHGDDVVTMETGLRYVQLEEGGGDKPKRGTLVTAHYAGKLTDGSEFDSSYSRGPFQFQVGAGEVIPGWDQAFLDMRKGEKRLLILPPELAYGEDGVGPIPPNATLIFEVELVDF